MTYSLSVCDHFRQLKVSLTEVEAAVKYMLTHCTAASDCSFFGDTVTGCEAEVSLIMIHLATRPRHTRAHAHARLHTSIQRERERQTLRLNSRLRYVSHDDIPGMPPIYTRARTCTKAHVLEAAVLFKAAHQNMRRIYTQAHKRAYMQTREGHEPDLRWRGRTHAHTYI